MLIPIWRIYCVFNFVFILLKFSFLIICLLGLSILTMLHTHIHTLFIMKNMSEESWNWKLVIYYNLHHIFKLFNFIRIQCLYGLISHVFVFWIKLLYELFGIVKNQMKLNLNGTYLWNYIFSCFSIFKSLA